MKIIFFFLFLTATLQLPAQVVDIPVNTEGPNATEILKFTWKSSWINHPSSSATDYGVFHFRKNFQLESIPEHLIVYVSADNRYKLYVNGQYIGYGPARGDQLHWNYETIDIAPALKTGNNIIAAEVTNFGPERPVAQHTFQTGFILQAKDSAYDYLNSGVNSWKVFRNNAFHPISISFATVNGYYAAGPCDSVDAAQYPWKWKEAEYNDSEWQEARISNLAVSRGYIYGNALHLVPRSIPAMETKAERFPVIARTDHPSGKKKNFISGVPTVIAKNSSTSFLLDLKYLTTGYPQLNLSGGAGSVIKITYAEALLDDKGAKGNRNDVSGKHIHGYYDIYRPDGGNDRAFETLWQRTFRFVQIDIQTGNEDLVLNDYHNVFTAYPFVQNAQFNSDKPELRQIWDVAWRTARLCAGETYFDCPYYEQLQYIGDTRIQALISLYVSGDDRLMRNALELFDHSRIQDGLTLSRYPSQLPQIIPPFSLMWINMVHDYHLYRGDSLFLSKFAQGIQNVLQWYESRIDSTGLLGRMDWWSFTDYTEGYPLGIPPDADRGHSAVLTLQYAYALKNAIELMKYFKKDAVAEKYEKQLIALRKSIIDNCYDPQKGLIADEPAKKYFSLHATIFGILSNTIAEPQQQQALIKAMADKTLTQPSIYFRFYLFRCLQLTGLGDKYFEQIGTWKNMLKEGLTTFAESDSNTRSDCHAWSASPMFDFLHLVTGIQPASPGFKTILVEPHFGELNVIDATFPHPAGKVLVHLEKKAKNKVAGYIELPPGLSGTFRYMNKEVSLKEGTREKINY